MSRKFYRSGQFMLTLDQIEWLNNRENASQTIRWLIELAMSSESFETYCDVLALIEEQIAKGERARTHFSDLNTKLKLEEWKERRKNVLAKLITARSEPEEE